MRHAATHSRSSVLLWTAAILGFLLLSVAASLRADAADVVLSASASRTATWNASGDVKSVAIENINGEVKVVAGARVAATVEITAHGRTPELAKKALDKTKTLFSNDDGEVTMAIEPPGATVRRGGRHGFTVHAEDHGSWSVTARWSVTVPANVPLEVSTVNGPVSADGIGADLTLTSVNGKVVFAGARGNVKVSTVNGAVDGTFAAVPSGAAVSAEAVNGNVTLRMPKGASFRFSAHTMGGEILSTFPLPPARGERDEEIAAQREKVRSEREKMRGEREKARAQAERRRATIRERRSSDGDVETIEIDMKELDRTMADLDKEMAELSRSISRNVMIDLNRSYEGTVGSGGARVSVSNLNGKIVLLAEGTKEADAKPLVGARSGRVITIPAPPKGAHAVPAPPEPPRVVVRVPKPPRAPHAAPFDDEDEPSVVQGDVQGDFLTRLPTGDVRVGKVSGKVRISTHAGEIHVEQAGAGAELRSMGGDVSIGSVAGDLTADTLGGSVEAGSVSGSARLETQGGDVTLRSCEGSVTAKTGAGDIRIGRVKGGVRAATSGGSIECTLASAEPKESRLETFGGDVTLTIPANARATVEVVATGVPIDSRAIVSDFPEIAVEHGHARASASGKLNGGGAKLTVLSSSGTVTLRKGPPA